VAAVALVAGGGCHHSSGRPFDVAGAERQISADLASRTGLPSPVVHCPRSVTVQAGRSFTCTTSLDGQPATLHVSLTDAKGAFTSEPVEAVLLVAKAVAAIQSGIDRQTGEQATVDCGSHIVLVEHPGDTFPCTARAGTQSQAVTVTVRDTAGTLDYRTATPGSATGPTTTGATTTTTGH
jgi:hypothetical protein